MAKQKKRQSRSTARPAAAHHGHRARVTQVRSSIGCQQNQRPRCASLGLRKIRQSVERADTPQIRGMIHTVRHLVTVEEVEP